MPAIPLYLRREVEKKRTERFKHLLQEESPDAAALAKELRPLALDGVFGATGSISESCFVYAQEILRRNIDVPEAHLILMRCYRDGNRVEENIAKSDFHLAEAARKGNHAAQYLIASKDVEHSDPTIHYQGIATLIELALNGDSPKIREEALWSSVGLIRNSLDPRVLSSEDSEFIRLFGDNSRLGVQIKEAAVDLSTSGLVMEQCEDREREARTAQAKTDSLELHELRKQLRAFIARHQDRIRELSDPGHSSEDHKKNLAPRSQIQEEKPQRVSSGLWAHTGKQREARTEQSNIPLRVLAAIACILLGFFFFPAFFLGGLIAWSVYTDVVEGPARRAEQAAMDARITAPVSVERMRLSCESPAETAFLDAMVSAYDLQTGPGAIEGPGLRMQTQVGMGQFRIYAKHATHQYRADFLINEKLVVEIDGATYHSSPEAIARDKKRDIDLRREGYSILRIPAHVVFQNPKKALQLVEDARVSLLSG